MSVLIHDKIEKKQKSDKILIHLKTVKTLFRYAAPLCGSQAINILASIIPMLFIARLGSQQLAAAALATATFIIFSAPALFAMIAVGILIAKQHEKNAYYHIGLTFKHGLVFSMAMAGLLGVLLWHMSYVLQLFAQKPDLVKLITPYLHLAAISLIPMILLTLMKQLYIGIAKPKISLYISLLLTPLCILLSYAFIFGKFLMPKMAVTGIMVANLVAQSVVLFF